jgi:glycine cleavage system H protein
MTYPHQFRYTREHEWLHLEGKRGKIGITNHAQSELGDVVFVELPPVGKAIQKGEVAEVNTQLEISPEIINQDPHGGGWLVVLEVTDPSEAETLLTAEDYEQFLAES